MGEDGRTHEQILKAAQKEFLEKGFQAASLRRIVKEAGVTTGAFYRYYPTKEALFEALVRPYADTVTGFYKETLASFQKLPAGEQTGAMIEVSGDCIQRIVDYIYENYQGFKLLICSAGGTVYENFLHDLVEMEVESTYAYMEVLKSLGHRVPALDRQLCHMISTGMMSGIFEVAVHDMKKEDAKKRIAQLREFYTGGWERIMGVKFDGRKQGTPKA